jgi:Flp pilus assembly protein TadB
MFQPLNGEQIVSKSVIQEKGASESLKSPSPESSNLEIQESDKPSRQMAADEISRLWEHGLHEDTIFNERLNFFLIFESVLLGVVGVLYSRQPPVMKSFLVVMASLGLLITIIWGYIQAKHRSTLRILGQRCEEHLPEFKETHAILAGKKWRRVSGTWLLTYLIPFLVALVWIALLILFVQ